jgi:murein DD-endopeptidase MepM/ murein hydrolase activator NlpD
VQTLFPLPFRPKQSYKEAPRSFGAPRLTPPGRLHGACDLYAPDGTPVLACESGLVTLGPYLFYDGSSAIEVTTPDGRVFRYCEISPTLGVVAGAQVKAGEIVGRVRYLPTVKMSMLHFELYSGLAKGPLTQPSNGRFGRRSDLINPTFYLDGCVLAPRKP